MRGVEKYLVRWKGFTAEGGTWERRENLKNAEEALEDFEGKTEIRKQEKIEEAEDRGRLSCTEFSIEFSCVNPIQGSSPKPTLRFLSCNKLGQMVISSGIPT